jgi:hypothetical protein
MRLPRLRMGAGLSAWAARWLVEWRWRVGRVESLEAWRPVWGVVMQSFPFDTLDRIATQLTLTNVMLAVYLVCKGVGYTSRVVLRRDPPKKSIRSKLAQSNES